MTTTTTQTPDSSATSDATAPICDFPKCKCDPYDSRNIACGRRQFVPGNATAPAPQAATPSLGGLDERALESLMHKHGLIGVAGDNPALEAKLIAFANDAARHASNS
jgi:hypothetical protein